MKKGQIYLLAVVITAFLIYSLLASYNFMQKKSSKNNFKEISENYEWESSKLLNELLNKDTLDDQLLNDTFLNFTVAFSSYARTKDSSYGLLYAFPYNNLLFLGNYADTSATITAASNNIVLDGCFEKVNVSLSLGGISLSPDVDMAIYKDCIATIGYPTTDQVEINIEETDYIFDIKGDRADIIMIGRENLTEEIKVFISEY
tara:strand:+ start:221 stop:829 length:609 start_codon:yes stop_codon:yes gene_type:complete